MATNRGLAVLLTLVVGAAALLYSRDLQQRNPETLFLTASGMAEYDAFQERAPDIPMIVVKVEEDSERYEEVRRLLGEFDGFGVVGPDEVLPVSDEIDPRAAEALRLVSDEHFAFLIRSETAAPDFSKVIDAIQERLTGFHFKIAGIPYTNYLLDGYSATIKDKLFPLLFGVAFMILLAVTRRLKTALILFMPALFSAGVTLSAIKWLFGTMTMVTSTLPLMSFTVNLSLALHVYYSMAASPSVSSVLRDKWQPIALMLITTSIGFGSLYVSEIQVIRDFAAVSCFVVLLTAGLTLVWLYGWDFALKNQARRLKKNVLKARWFSSTLPRALILSFAGLATLSAVLVFRKIPVLTDATAYFPKSSHVKERIDDVTQTVAGLPMFDILLPLDADADATAEAIETLPLSQDYRVLTSEALDRVPREKMAVSLRHWAGGWVHGPYKRVLVLGTPDNVTSYEYDLTAVRGILPASSEINGLYYHLMMSQKAMIDVLIRSLLSSVVIVALLAFAYTRRWRVLLIFLFVNVVPVLISLNMLYVFGFSLNIATVMTYSIAMGIIVDSTFHMLHAMRHPRLSHEAFVQTVLTPIILSSGLFLACFGVLIFDEFVPIRQFGFNLCLILAVGLVFDVYVLPTLYLGHNRLKGIFHAPTD